MSAHLLHDILLASPLPSQTDLLDILSKGSNPQLILRHLPKNFDNVHNLSFRWARVLAGTLSLCYLGGCDVDHCLWALAAE